MRADARVPTCVAHRRRRRRSTRRRLLFVVRRRRRCRRRRRRDFRSSPLSLTRDCTTIAHRATSMVGARADAGRASTSSVQRRSPTTSTQKKATRMQRGARVSASRRRCRASTAIKSRGTRAANKIKFLCSSLARVLVVRPLLARPLLPLLMLLLLLLLLVLQRVSPVMRRQRRRRPRTKCSGSFALR